MIVNSYTNKAAATYRVLESQTLRQTISIKITSFNFPHRLWKELLPSSAFKLRKLDLGNLKQFSRTAQLKCSRAGMGPNVSQVITTSLILLLGSKLFLDK